MSTFIGGREVDDHTAQLVADWREALRDYRHELRQGVSVGRARAERMNALASEVERLGWMVTALGPWTEEELEAGVLDEVAS